VKNLGTLVCLFLLCAVFVQAQDLGSAVLSGNITDPSGASIAGAELMVTSKGTGIGRTATTNGTGLFTINALSPGDYDVRISAWCVPARCKV
jgi:uncharacterized surface anchored protein